MRLYIRRRRFHSRCTQVGCGFPVRGECARRSSATLHPFVPRGAFHHLASFKPTPRCARVVRDQANFQRLAIEIESAMRNPLQVAEFFQRASRAGRWSVSDFSSDERYATLAVRNGLTRPPSIQLGRKQSARSITIVLRRNVQPILDDGGGQRSLARSRTNLSILFPVLSRASDRADHHARFGTSRSPARKLAWTPPIVNEKYLASRDSSQPRVNQSLAKRGP